MSQLGEIAALRYSIYMLSYLAETLQKGYKAEEQGQEVKLAADLPRDLRGLSHLATLLSRGNTAEITEGVKIVAVSSGQFLPDCLNFSIVSSPETSPTVSPSNSAATVSEGNSTSMEAIAASVMTAASTATAAPLEAAAVNVDAAPKAAEAAATTPAGAPAAVDPSARSSNTAALVIARNSSSARSPSSPSGASTIIDIPQDMSAEFVQNYEWVLRDADEAAQGLALQNFNLYAEVAVSLLKTASLHISRDRGRKREIIAALSTFFIRCCLGKIRHRSQQIENHYDFSKKESLSDWTITDPSFKDFAVHVASSGVRALLDDAGLHPEISNPSVFKMTTTTAPILWRTIIATFHFLRQSLGPENPSSATVTLIYEASKGLHELLQAARPLWGIASLNEHMKSFVKIDEGSSIASEVDTGSAAEDCDENIVRDAISNFISI
ncbi:hypothetical protein FB45DRAFT_969601 [Roridomyces roridus]|uniref:Uncharacterized protein n=1 Tax=Roridomyces roridus TaxID=1738132 RepID=A0AAD7F7P9_9AGAR|nr:hypothetical protein FB45DRAFT_969601 [Roridomyces roridus]